MNNKLKILVCAYSCLGDPDKRFGQGGEGVLGWNLSKQLAKFSEVYILTHSQNREVIEKKLKEEPNPNLNFFYLELPKSFSFLNHFGGGVQIYAYLWQIKAYFLAKKLHRKIHFNAFHHITYANDWMASFVGALLPVPYVRGPGGGAHKVPKSFLTNFSFKSRLGQYFRTVSQWLFRHDPFFLIGQKKAKAILVCNYEAMRAIPSKWRNKVYLFPVNGISQKDLDLLKSKEGKVEDKNKFKILSAGKLLNIKGFDLALRAFGIFSKGKSDVKLSIVGNGPQLPYLKNLAKKLNLDGKVEFEGWKPRKELLKELRSSDVFLFPSLRDGGGQVVVEAMAASKPVVCLDIAGPGFHISKEWGIKIKPTSPQEAIKGMAEALEKLYSNKEIRINLGRKARKRAEDFYHWDKLGERLLEIYREILNKISN